MKILPLKAIPEHIPEIARWVFNEWGHFDPTNSLDATISRLYARTNDDRLPIAFVAIDSSIPVGCVSIKFDDMKIRPNLNPWLGSLFVVPHMRKMGIGSALVQRAIDFSVNSGILTIYLWTEVAVDFYKHFGFREKESVDYLNQHATIMERIAG